MADLPLVFQFEAYRPYLKKLAGPTGKRSGMRTELAKAMNCQASYLTRVLGEIAHLSLEQAYLLSVHLGHSPEERDFFLLLVEWERAGSAPLRRHFRLRIEEILRRRLEIKSRVSIPSTISPLNEAIYYSSWQYAALHMAVTIPGFNTRSKLARHFGLSLRRTSEILDFLISAGLVIDEGRGLRAGALQIHLDSRSAHISRHHANWRQQAMLAMELERTDDLHYSAVVTLSKKDLLKLRELTLDFLRQSTTLIKASPEEELACLAIDLFALGSASSATPS